MSEESTVSSNGRIANISFSFIFTLGSIIELVILVFFLLGGYFILSRYSKELEFSFLENGKQWTVNASALAQNAIENQSYDVLTQSYISALHNASAQGAKVEEVFFLRADGVVKAHNDYSEIANPAVDGVKQISSRYNNEYFHASLLGNEGEVMVQNYEPVSLAQTPKLTKMVAFLLPKDFSRSSDFSTAVHVKGKAVGTVHVIASRSYVYNFLPSAIRDYGILLLFFMVGGLGLTVLLTVFFSARVQYLENIWKRVFRSEGDLYSMLTQVEKKIDKLEFSPQHFFTTAGMDEGERRNENHTNTQHRENEVLEAILVEE